MRRFWYNERTGESTKDMPSDAIEKAMTAKNKFLKREASSIDDTPQGTGAQVYNRQDFDDMMMTLESPTSK